jgi:hypothetical protein
MPFLKINPKFHFIFIIILFFHFEGFKNLEAQQITRVWKGKIDKKKVEIKSFKMEIA